MESIITAIISAVSAIIVAEISIKKAIQQKDIVQARTMQQYEDRITAIEKKTAQNEMILEKLNNIELTIVGMKKDIEYFRKDDNK